MDKTILNQRLKSISTQVGALFLLLLVLSGLIKALIIVYFIYVEPYDKYISGNIRTFDVSEKPDKYAGSATTGNLKVYYPGDYSLRIVGLDTLFFKSKEDIITVRYDDGEYFLQDMFVDGAREKIKNEWKKAGFSFFNAFVDQMNLDYLERNGSKEFEMDRYGVTPYQIISLWNPVKIYRKIQMLHLKATMPMPFTPDGKVSFFRYLGHDGIILVSKKSMTLITIYLDDNKTIGIGYIDPDWQLDAKDVLDRLSRFKFVKNDAASSVKRETKNTKNKLPDVFENIIQESQKHD